MNETRNAIRKKAAFWFTRMHSAPPDHVDRSRFEQWLLASEMHAEEYNAFAQLMENFADTSRLQSMASTIEQNKANRAEQSKQMRKSNLRNIGGLVLVAVTGFLLFQSWTQWYAKPVMQMASATAIGETGKQQLADGSALTLDADSHVEVTYYRDKRMVKLTRGEVIFNVAKDPDRPFIVDGGKARITVLGTHFVVNRLNNLVRVSVARGTVKVEAQSEDGNSMAAPVILKAGEVAEVIGNAQPAKVKRNAESAFSFERGNIAFEQASLEEMAETLSRYQKPAIAVGVKTSDPRVTALVQSNNIGGFLDLLPLISNVSVVKQPTKTVLSSKPD